MKKFTKLALLAAFAGFSAILSAAPAQHIDFESKHDFRFAGVNYQKDAYIAMVPGGVKGKCFRLACPKDKKSLSFHNWTRPQIKLKSSSTPIKFSIYMKGKGTVSYGFISYAAKNGKRYCIYPPGTTKKVTINSDKWQKYEFTYTPVAGKLFANQAAYIMPYLSVYSDSVIYIDELMVEFIDPTSNIQIED